MHSCCDETERLLPVDAVGVPVELVVVGVRERAGDVVLCIGDHVCLRTVHVAVGIADLQLEHVVVVLGVVREPVAIAIGDGADLEVGRMTVVVADEVTQNAVVLVVVGKLRDDRLDRSQLRPPGVIDIEVVVGGEARDGEVVRVGRGRCGREQNAARGKQYERGCGCGASGSGHGSRLLCVARFPVRSAPATCRASSACR